MAPDPDMSDKLDLKQTRLIQGIADSLLCYYQSIDPKMLTALNEILREQVTQQKTQMKKQNSSLIIQPHIVQQYYVSILVT